MTFCGYGTAHMSRPRASQELRWAGRGAAGLELSIQPREIKKAVRIGFDCLVTVVNEPALVGQLVRFRLS